MLGLNVAEDKVKELSRRARNEQLRIHLGSAEKESYETIAGLFFIGYELAKSCNERREIEGLMYEGIASIFRIEYDVLGGEEPLEEDLETVKTAVDTAIEEVKHANNFEFLAAEAAFSCRREEHLANFRAFVRKNLDEYREALAKGEEPSAEVPGGAAL